MKKRNILAILICFTLVISMFMTACGKKAPATLEEYLATDSEAAQEINETAENSGLDVDITGNDVVYSYDLKNFEGVDETLAKSDVMIQKLEEGLAGNADHFKELCSKLEEESSMEGIRIIVNYTYDGEVLATKTFNSEGIVEE